MEQVYTNISRQLKALSDPKRLKIADMLSCGEICACGILDYFQITQPTLSHDMKVLMDVGIVTSRREGKNIYYSLDGDNLHNLLQMLDRIFKKKENCICGDLKCTCKGRCCDEEE